MCVPLCVYAAPKSGGDHFSLPKGVSFTGGETFPAVRYTCKLCQREDFCTYYVKVVSWWTCGRLPSPIDIRAPVCVFCTARHLVRRPSGPGGGRRNVRRTKLDAGERGYPTAAPFPKGRIVCYVTNRCFPPVPLLIPPLRSALSPFSPR